MSRFGYWSARLTVLALAVALWAPAASARNRTLAPPGNSGIGQYVEVVPTAGGGKPTATIHTNGGGGGLPGGGGSGGAGSGGAGSGAAGSGSAVPPATAAALASHGAEGRAASNLARATAPTRSAAARNAAASGSGSGSTSGSSSPISSVLKALTGSSGGGLGPIVPAVLIASLVGGGALALRRRRTT